MYTIVSIDAMFAVGHLGTTEHTPIPRRFYSRPRTLLSRCDADCHGMLPFKRAKTAGKDVSNTQGSCCDPSRASLAVAHHDVEDEDLYRWCVSQVDNSGERNVVLGVWGHQLLPKV